MTNGKYAEEALRGSMMLAKIRRFPLAAALIFVAVLCFTFVYLKQSKVPFSFLNQNLVELPYLNEGCSAYSQSNLVVRSFPEFSDLYVKCGIEILRVKSIVDLKGKVTIRNENEALTYARLTTNAYTHLWGNGVEIRHRAAVKETGAPTEYGVLSFRSFKLGGFSEPEITRAGNNFEIVRWVFSWDKTVSEIEESVGPNGSYARKILKTRACPVLPDTNWMFPVYE